MAAFFKANLVRQTNAVQSQGQSEDDAKFYGSQIGAAAKSQQREYISTMKSMSYMRLILLGILYVYDFILFYFLLYSLLRYRPQNTTCVFNQPANTRPNVTKSR